MARRKIPSLFNFHLCPLALFLSLFFLPLCSWADDLTKLPASSAGIVLTLTNGDRFSGTVIAIHEDSLEIENKYAGRLKIRLTEIKDWQATNEELRLRLTAVMKKAVAAPTMAEKEKGQRVVANAPPSAKPVNHAARVAKAANAAKAAQSESWKRQVNFAYTMTRGNVKASDVAASFNVSRQKGVHKVAFTSSGRRGSRDGRESANLLSSLFRYERTLFKLPVFAESQFEIDKLKKLDYRVSENLGISYPVLKGEAQKLAFDFGTGVTREEYETGLQKLTATSLLRLKASQKLTSKTILNEQATFFSDLADPNMYRIQTEASLTTPITKNLALHLSGINRYDARPQTQVKPNDFTLLTGFTFHF